MLIQTMLEDALTGMLSEKMLDHGTRVLDKIRAMEIVSESELKELEESWRAMLEKRKQETASAEQELRTFLADLRALLDHRMTTPTNSSATREDTSCE